MPSRPAPTARSSSRSSKTGDPRGPAADGLPTVPPDPTAIAVGVVAGAHALRGLLRVRPFHAGGDSLAPGATLFLERDGVWRRTCVRSAAPHGAGMVLVDVDGIDDRTAAEALRGARVLIPADALPPPAEDEFYWHEVVGFAVETVAGERLGTVAETMATGLNDVWVVRDGAREVLLPVIADVVRTIDRAGRRIVVEPLPGLLE